MAIFLGAVRFFAVARFLVALVGLLPNVLEGPLRVALAGLLRGALEPLFFDPVVFALGCARPLLPRRDLELVFFADFAMTKPFEDEPAVWRVRQLKMDTWDWPAIPDAA